MSRFTMCDCPAGFGAGAERHAPDCPGRVTDCTRVTAADFGASRPVVQARGYIGAAGTASFLTAEDAAEFLADVNAGYSAQRAAFQELLQKTRREQHELQDTLLLTALGMTAEEALDNRHRITRHQYPDKDVFLLDGEPVVEIHKPVIRGDELVTSYRNLRKTDRGVS